MLNGYAQDTAGKRYQVYGWGDGEFCVVNTSTDTNCSGIAYSLEDALDYANYRNRIGR